MRGTVHFRLTHQQSKAPYPACFFDVDTLSGVTTKNPFEVTCRDCIRRGHSGGRGRSN